MPQPDTPIPVIRWLRSLNGRLKAWAIRRSLQLDRGRGAEKIAAAIERAGAVGRPQRDFPSEHEALVAEIRADQAATDARIARQVGQS